ncbi:MAG: hypothetical protein ACLUN9_17675 [Enterocloster aldenensis]
MRLRRSRLVTYHHREAIPKKDSEGSAYTEYGPAVPFQAEEWPAGGKVQAEMYGQRLPNIRNLRIQGAYQEVPGAGKVSYESRTVRSSRPMTGYACMSLEGRNRIIGWLPYTLTGS